MFTSDGQTSRIRIQLCCLEEKRNVTKQCRHIIWDWNGTLFDDAWLCIEIVNSMLSRRNRSPITLARYRQIFDFPVESFYSRIGFDFSLETYKDVSAEFISEYDKRRFECKLRKDALHVLETTTKAGLSHSLLSVYPHRGLEELADFFSIRGYFVKLLGLDGYHAAGKLENGRSMVEALDFARDEIRMVGDTVYDFQVASAIGVSCVLIASGHNSRDRLESCGVRVVDSLSDSSGELS